MLVEDTLAELSEVLHFGELLVDIGLHEQRERFTGDLLCVRCRADPHTMRRCAELACSCELESFTGLEGKAVGWDGDLRKIAATCANVKPRCR